MLGLLFGLFLASGTNPEGFGGLAVLYGPLIAGPTAFMVGFPVGFVIGAAREWYRQWAI